ncbi:hypothetical protein HDF19_20090 [Mucilaginibacter sp. E4BP6]|uniref:hypothetical protein n=1 Tax=Mucilaginibacter sp. E4BP6 TaxID=2723089 RepID=UPI0015CD6037|nr:hypothetical protein [Mucilaginibacter sp. E4BP6]NYE67296.1 hypothetical protein [Mucilaginibacter sp. E4BP6]
MLTFIGIAFLVYGIYLTISEIKVFNTGKQSEFGWDIKGLGAGICCIMIGIYLIAHYI